MPNTKQPEQNKTIDFKNTTYDKLPPEYQKQVDDRCYPDYYLKGHKPYTILSHLMWKIRNILK